MIVNCPGAPICDQTFNLGVKRATVVQITRELELALLPSIVFLTRTLFFLQDIANANMLTCCFTSTHTTVEFDLFTSRLQKKNLMNTFEF